MTRSNLRSVCAVAAIASLALALEAGCSSAALDVAEGVTDDAAAIDTATPTPDTAKPDAGGPDSSEPPDSATIDTSVVDSATVDTAPIPDGIVSGDGGTTESGTIDSSDGCTAGVPCKPTGLTTYGKCGTATVHCDAVGTPTCVDPLASAPTLGTACGSCGNFACTPDNTAITCRDLHDDRCTAAPYQCDAPTCSASGATSSACSYPRGAASACDDAQTCTADACVDATCVANAGAGFDPTKGPLTTCATPKTGCKHTLVLDADNDGYSADAACSISLSTVADCNDGKPEVHPNQTLYFTTPLCDSAAGSCTPLRQFDYNCDGSLTFESTDAGGCTRSGATCVLTAGWVGTIPGCGLPGKGASGCLANTSGGCDTYTVTKYMACH